MYGEDGQLRFVYSVSEGVRDGRPWADGVWRPSSSAVTDAVDAALSAFPGWAFSTSDLDLMAALLSAGAQQVRHAHVMSNDLSIFSGEPPSDGLQIEPLTSAQVNRHAARLGALRFAAYPPEHPDHSHRSVEQAADGMRAVARGEVLGPMLRQSRVALYGGEIVGACLVVGRDGVPPEGGPWILDVFRDADSPAKAVGRSLLNGVLNSAHAGGLPAISLAVSHSNRRAVSLYAALGFRDASETWTLVLTAR